MVMAFFFERFALKFSASKKPFSRAALSAGYSVAAEPPFRRGEYRKTGIAYRRV